MLQYKCTFSVALFTSLFVTAVNVELYVLFISGWLTVHPALHGNSGPGMKAIVLFYKFVNLKLDHKNIVRDVTIFILFYK